jgi:hypothetical protein
MQTTSSQAPAPQYVYHLPGFLSIATMFIVTKDSMPVESAGTLSLLPILPGVLPLPLRTPERSVLRAPFLLPF